MIEPGGTLARVLRAGHFAVTGEIVPPRSADGSSVTEHARELVGSVDAVNVTDNPQASPFMTPVAGVRFAAEAGIEPTVQITCRDRNSLGITADLLGAWALGARNAFFLAGDPLSVGDHPDAAAVFDLSANEAVALARRMRDEGTTLAGATLEVSPSFMIGVAELPLADPYDPAKLEARLDAGADFVMTQIAYDVEALAAWTDVVRPRGLFERASVMVGVTPLRSAKQARFLNEKLFGVSVPAAMIEALDDAGDGAREVGLDLTVDIVKAIRGIDGVAGVHLMGIGDDAAVRAVVEGAGLFPRPVV